MMAHVMNFKEKNDELCKKVVDKVKGTRLEGLFGKMDTLDPIKVQRIHNEKSDITQQYFENGYQLHFTKDESLSFF